MNLKETNFPNTAVTWWRIEAFDKYEPEYKLMLNLSMG
jgi:hypothetical protein